ncbi:MAG: TRAP transporter small permease [Burkholderiales bacterium]|nr:TRAP transporter small permease [Burkholderiales bacterium]
MTVREDTPPAPPTDEPLKAEDWAAALMMAALCLITFANVLVRYFTDESFAWTEEISIFLMMAMAMAAGAAAYARDRHIRIEYFFAGGGAARQRRLAIFSALCVLMFFAGLAVLGARMTWDDYRFAETTSGMSWPKWPFTIWLPLLSLLIVARTAGLLKRSWSGRG